MSEIQITEDVEGEVPEQVEQQPQQKEELSNIEKQALEMGWRPKEEWDGAEEEFIDAQEYVRRKPLFDKIGVQNKEIKEIRKALRELQSHHARVAEASYKQAYEDLKVQYKKALNDGDVDKVTDLTEQIADLKATEKVRQAAPQPQQQPHPGFVQWVEKNSWYAQDSELRIAADQIGLAYAQANPQFDPDQVLEYVTKRIKRMYSERFTNPNREKPALVDGGSKSKPASKADNFDLSEEEYKVMQTFVRQGIMTEKQYKDELKKVRSL